MSKIYIKEKKKLGCFNILVWDFFMVVFIIGILSNTYLKIHPILCIILGIAIAGITIALMNIKYVGIGVQILYSLFWTAIIFDCLNSFFGIGKTQINTILAVSIIFLICFLLHIAYLKEINEEPEFIFNQKQSNKSNSSNLDLTERYKILIEKFNNTCVDFEKTVNEIGTEIPSTINQIIYLYNEQVAKFKVYIDLIENHTSIESLEKYMVLSDQIINEIYSLSKELILEASKSSLKRNDKKINIDIQLFAGCDTLDSLKKRYRDLLKMYHPDNANGDNSMTLIIQSTYDKLCQDKK